MGSDFFKQTPLDKLTYRVVSRVDRGRFELPTPSLSRYVVVDPTGFEPVTSSLQMKRSTTKLRAHHNIPGILDYEFEMSFSIADRFFHFLISSSLCRAAP